MNRDESIDMLKGFGILLMLIGHVQFGADINHYIYSFHMPLFFWTSGFLFKYRNRDIFSYFKKSGRALILPYFVYGGIFTVLFSVYQHEINLSDVCIKFLYPNHYPFDWCGAIWFLPAMFFVKLLYFVVNKYLKRKQCWFVAIIAIVIGILCSSFQIHIPLAIDSALFGFGFYCLGVFSKEIMMKKLDIKNHQSLIILFFIISGLCFLNKVINMRENTYGNYFLFGSSSIAGILMWYCIFKIKTIKEMFKLKEILSMLSRNSIAYMGFNQFLIAIINVFIISKVQSNFIAFACKIGELLSLILLIYFFCKVISLLKVSYIFGIKKRD